MINSILNSGQKYTSQYLSTPFSRGFTFKYDVLYPSVLAGSYMMYTGYAYDRLPAF